MSFFIILSQLHHIIEADEPGVVIIPHSLCAPVDYLFHLRNLFFDREDLIHLLLIIHHHNFCIRMVNDILKLRRN